MAKVELTDDEETTAEDILKTLAGYTVKQAEAILKEVAARLKERAVIE